MSSGIISSAHTLNAPGIPALGRLGAAGSLDMIQTVADCTLAVTLLRHLGARREDIVRFRDARLRRLIDHAYRTVPYYRRLFDAHGIDPRAIRSAADLVRLPRTSKRDLHSLPVHQVLSAGVDPASLITRVTGGSSGEPLVIRRSRREERVLSVVRRRMAPYYGYRLRDLLVVTSAPRESQSPHEVSWMLRAFQLLGILQARHVSCLAPVSEIAERLKELQPGVLGGYPSVLARVGQHLIETGSTAVRPQLVLTGGEVRTSRMREQIAAAFAAPVYDTYGSHEFNRIAYECRDTGACHVCDDSVVVEVLDADGQPVNEGEKGELVGTALFSWTMPFIRYRLGDIVVKGSSSCACGAPFSTIHSIQGRMVDYFTLPDGRLLHPYELASATLKTQETLRAESWSSARPFPWLGEYRYVQDRRDHVTLYLVPIETPPPCELDAIDHSLRRVLGPGVALDIVLQARLELEPNGKFRVYQSMVDPTHGPSHALAVASGGGHARA